MKKEDKKALESVKDMFADVTIEDIDEQRITIYGAAMLDVIRVLNLAEKQQKEIEKIKTFKIEDENIYLQFGEITEKKRWQDKIKTKIEILRKQEKEEPDAHLGILILESILKEGDGE